MTSKVFISLGQPCRLASLCRAITRSDVYYSYFADQFFLNILPARIFLFKSRWRSKFAAACAEIMSDTAAMFARFIIFFLEGGVNLPWCQHRITSWRPTLQGEEISSGLQHGARGQKYRPCWLRTSYTAQLRPHDPPEITSAGQQNQI